jgi:sec-independent protein translocase protein TatB
MLGVGWTEMLVIGVVALIVIGPKELPALMHRIGKFAGTIRRMGQDFQRELNKTTGLNEVKNLRASITAPLKATTDAIRKEFNTTTSTGAVQPSGVLKPADPKAESVVNEIHAAAGMKPAALPLTAAAAAAQAPSAQTAMKDAVSKRVAEIEAAKVAPVTAKPTRVKAASKTVAAVPAKPKAAPKKTVAKKAVESPAPVEAIAPIVTPKAAATKKPAVKKAVPKRAAEVAPVAVAKPKRKPAAKTAPVTKA